MSRIIRYFLLKIKASTLGGKLIAKFNDVIFEDGFVPEQTAKAVHLTTL